MLNSRLKGEVKKRRRNVTIAAEKRNHQPTMKK